MSALSEVQMSGRPGWSHRRSPIAFLGRGHRQCAKRRLRANTGLIAGFSKSAPAQSAGELVGAFHYSRSLADMTLWQLNLAFGSFAAMLAAGIAITMGIQRHYRCPKCETVPMRSWTTFGPGGIGRHWGVEFNPSICRKCGARLR
jgi:hypothetical protein